MDLKTGELYWPALTTPLNDPSTADVVLGTHPLDRDLDCQVLVVGAGVTGALVAANLAEAGIDVAVVDRRGPVAGSTPASTAMVQYEIDTALIDLAAIHGLDRARRAYRAARRALDDLSDLVSRHGIDCGLRWCGSLYLATRADEYDRFFREAEARQAIGIEVEPLTRRQLLERFDLNRPGALFSTAAIDLNPVALAFGLLAAARQRGVRLFAPVDAHLERLADRPGGKHLLRTDAGRTIRCQHVVFATGYEAPEQFRGLARLCTLKSTYALASEPLGGGPPWPGRVMLWESARPYFYARQTDDNRVIIGGEDEEIVDPLERDALIDVKAELLCGTLAQLCPDLDVRPEFTWAGTFAETHDSLPYIGQPGPSSPGCHFTLGYGGNGITFGVLAAQIIGESVLGRAHPDADLFAFDR